MRPDLANTRRRRREQGSALLIVFVFAAIVAIMLYKEMPVSAFEARRQKEELLISRGKAYTRAIKLFVRKTGHYPSSLKDLDDTNHMRFLRHDYVDPFTGKADWRLLHAGPGGIILDSKIKGTGGMIAPGTAPGQQNQNGATPTGTASFGGGGFTNSSSSSGFANSSSSSGAFGSNGFASNNDSFAKPPQSTSDASTDNTPPEVTVQQPHQRGPAVAAAGSAPAAAKTDPASDASMALPPLPPNDGSQPDQKTAKHLQGAPMSGVAAANPAQNAVTPSGTPMTAMPGDVNGQPDMKAAMIGVARSGGGFGSSSFGQMGNVQSGGIAGVASKAGGDSIKLVHDQDNYSLWEFYYDPRKDTVPGGVQMGAFGQQGAQGQNGQNGQSTFGQGLSSSGASSSFGQSSGSGQSSGAGTNNSQQSPGAQNGPPAVPNDVPQN